MAMDMLRSGARKAEAKTGAGAVQLSTQQNSMQMNTQAVAADDKDAKEQIIIRNTASNQFIANKNFINQGSVWIDAEYSEGAGLPEVSIKFASDEYFRLVEHERELSPYLSLGEQVVIVWKGKVYRITK